MVPLKFLRSNSVLFIVTVLILIDFSMCFYIENLLKVPSNMFIFQFFRIN